MRSGCGCEATGRRGDQALGERLGDRARLRRVRLREEALVARDELHDGPDLAELDQVRTPHQAAEDRLLAQARGEVHREEHRLVELLGRDLDPRALVLLPERVPALRLLRVLDHVGEGARSASRPPRPRPQRLPLPRRHRRPGGVRPTAAWSRPPAARRRRPRPRRRRRGPRRRWRASCRRRRAARQADSSRNSRARARGRAGRGSADGSAWRVLRCGGGGASDQASSASRGTCPGARAASTRRSGGARRRRQGRRGGGRCARRVRGCGGGACGSRRTAPGPGRAGRRLGSGREGKYSPRAGDDARARRSAGDRDRMCNSVA